MFTRGSLSLAEWRWGSLMECTTRVLRVMAPLRLYWDQRRLYYQEDVGGDADAVDRSVLAGEDATMDLLRKCTDAVNDPLFWSYAHMVNSIGDDVISPFNRWLLSCTCHPRGDDNDDGIDPPQRRPGEVCPMMGRLGPQMAVGTWHNFLRTMLQKSSAAVLPHTRELSAKQRAILLGDYAKGKMALLTFLHTKLSFYDKLPYCLLGAAHDDIDIARASACETLAKYESLGDDAAAEAVKQHALMRLYLAKDGPLQKAFFDFAVGRVDRCGLLAHELIKLRLVMVVEISIEAKHAMAKNKLKAKTRISPVLFSLSMRLPEVKKMLAASDDMLMAFSQQFQRLKVPVEFVAAFQMIDIESIALADTQSMYRSIKGAFYHCDSSQFNSAKSTNMKMPRPHKSRQIASQSESRLGKALRQHVQLLGKPGAIYSCLIQGDFTLTSLSERMHPDPQRGACPRVFGEGGVDADIAVADGGGGLRGGGTATTATELVEFSEAKVSSGCFAVLAEASVRMGVQLPGQQGQPSRFFFRIIKTKPKQWKQPLAGSAGEDLFSEDTAITIHRVTVDSGNKGVLFDLDPLIPSSQERAASPVCLWRAPAKPDSLELRSIIIEWEATSFVSFELPAEFNGSSSHELRAVVNDLMESQAFSADYDVHSEVVSALHISRDRDPRKYECLCLMLSHGLVDCLQDAGTRSSWVLTRAGLLSLKPRVWVQPRRRFCKARPDTPLADMTVLELYDVLTSDGFTFREIAARTPRNTLPPYTLESSAEEKIIYLHPSMTAFPKWYLLALADAASHKQPVLHLQKAIYYQELLGVVQNNKKHDLGAALPALAFDCLGGEPALTDLPAKPDCSDGGDVEDKAAEDDSNLAGSDVEDKAAEDGSDLETDVDSDVDDSSSRSKSDGKPSESSSSSSSSSSDDDGDGDAPHEHHGGVSRVVRPETFTWGDFRFTWRPKKGDDSGLCGAYQALCPHHGAGSKTKCTRTRVVRAEDTSATVLLLKAWCLRWASSHDKDEHQDVPDADLQCDVGLDLDELRYSLDRAAVHARSEAETPGQDEDQDMGEDAADGSGRRVRRRGPATSPLKNTNCCPEGSLHLFFMSPPISKSQMITVAGDQLRIPCIIYHVSSVIYHMSYIIYRRSCIIDQSQI